MDPEDCNNNNKENPSCSSSDSNPCPICLAPFLQESYLDTCVQDVEVILHHILGVVDSFLSRNERMHPTETLGMKQEEFKALVSNAARPFLTAKADRFVNELELFLASGLNIEAYDEVYMQRLGWNSPKTSEASGESIEPNPVVPYLYVFDADSDESD